jgi:hypothetical protein
MRLQSLIPALALICGCLGARLPEQPAQAQQAPDIIVVTTEKVPETISSTATSEAPSAKETTAPTTTTQRLLETTTTTSTSTTNVPSTSTTSTTQKPQLYSCPNDFYGRSSFNVMCRRGTSGPMDQLEKGVSGDVWYRLTNGIKALSNVESVVDSPVCKYAPAGVVRLYTSKPCMKPDVISPRSVTKSANPLNK